MIDLLEKAKYYPLSRRDEGSTDVFQRPTIPLFCSQIRLEDPAEDLEEDLEAGFGDGRVVAPLAELVADEGVLGPGELVPVEGDARGAHLGANQVAPGVGDVGVADAKDHGGLASQVGEEVEGVRAVRRRGLDGEVWARVGAQGAAVYVGGEEADGGGDAGVELGEVRVSDIQSSWLFFSKESALTYCCSQG